MDGGRALNWRPIAEPPATSEPVSVLMAQRAEDGEWFMTGIALWRCGQWVSEDGLEPLTDLLDCWWASEDDVLKDLPA